MVIYEFCVVALVVSALITGDFIFHANLNLFEKNQNGRQVLPRRLDDVSHYRQDVGMKTELDWLHVWLPQDIKQNYNMVCDPESAGFQFRNREKLSKDDMQTLATWIALGSIAWDMVKLLLPMIFPPRPPVSPAQEWQCRFKEIPNTMTHIDEGLNHSNEGSAQAVDLPLKKPSEQKTQDEKDLDFSKKVYDPRDDNPDLQIMFEDQAKAVKGSEQVQVKKLLEKKWKDDKYLDFFKTAYDPLDDNPEEFKANLQIMLEDQAKAVKYVEMCLQKPASVTVPIVKMSINYPWNRKTQNLIFFAVVMESFLDITLTVFIRAPRLHWFYTDLDWFSLTFRPEIYCTVFYCLARLWVNQWQLDKLAGEGEKRFFKFFQKVDAQKEKNENWCSFSTWRAIFDIDVASPLGYCCNTHLYARLVIFLAAIMPFLPVTLFTAIGWVVLGCLMAFLWHRVVGTLNPQCPKDVWQVGFVLGWASVVCLLAGLWAFGYFWLPAPWYWLEIIFIPAWVLVAILVGYYHGQATTSEKEQPLTREEQKKQDLHKLWVDFTTQPKFAFKFSIFSDSIHNMKNAYMRIYMGLYLALCLANCSITGALSLYVFPVSANTYLCPNSQLKIFTTGTGAMGSTFLTIAALMLAVMAGLAIAAKCSAEHLDISGCASRFYGQSSTKGKSTTLSASVWFYKLWLWQSVHEQAEKGSWFCEEKIKEKMKNAS